MDATTIPIFPDNTTFAPENLTASVSPGHWVSPLALVVSSFSLLGSFLIILTFIIFRDIRTTSREILAHLSLADMLSSAALVWGVAASYDSSSELGCQIQSVLLIYFGISEVLWTCALAFYLFVIITRESEWGRSGCPRSLLLICWGVGLIITPVACGLGKTGVDKRYWNTARWCLVRGAEDKKMGGSAQYVLWSMIVGDGWNFLAIAWTLVFYILTKRHLRGEVW